MKIKIKMMKNEIEIRDYFKKHKTVLTIYSMHSYRIQDINFEQNPFIDVDSREDSSNQIFKNKLI